MVNFSYDIFKALSVALFFDKAHDFDGDRGKSITGYKKTCSTIIYMGLQRLVKWYKRKKGKKQMNEKDYLKYSEEMKELLFQSTMMFFILPCLGPALMKREHWPKTIKVNNHIVPLVFKESMGHHWKNNLNLTARIEIPHYYSDASRAELNTKNDEVRALAATSSNAAKVLRDAESALKKAKTAVKKAKGRTNKEGAKAERQRRAAAVPPLKVAAERAKEELKAKKLERGQLAKEMATNFFLGNGDPPPNCAGVAAAAENELSLIHI